MQEIISPYTIEYKGKLSDQHIIYSEGLALSILGASKVSTSIVYYIFTGKCLGQAIRNNMYVSSNWVRL